MDLYGHLHEGVDEAIGATLSFDVFLANGRPQRGMNLLLRYPEDARKHRGLGDVSEARHLLQCSLRRSRQPRELEGLY